MVRTDGPEGHRSAERGRSGAILPVSREPSFSTTRCVTVSTLCQTTVWPAGTVSAGFGENDWAPFSRTTLMTVAPAGGAVVPVGLVSDELLSLPHP